MREIEAVAVRAAKDAGALLRDNLGKDILVEFKGAVDLVTEMDTRAEDLITGRIREAFPGHGILTEEAGESNAGSESRWIIDPLDGTTNYAHGLPAFSVSIAFEYNGEVVVGAVYNPMLDELFVASKGQGARLNGTKISVSKVTALDRSLLATGFPYDIRTSKETNIDHFTAFAKKAQAIRRIGSAALDLSYVACGRFDGFWEMKLRPWDTAAAGLIVREAGGRLTDFNGNPFSIYKPECLATNGVLHDEMLRVLDRGHASGSP